MNPTIGAFQLGASRRSLASARLTVRGSSAARRDTVELDASDFFVDANCNDSSSIETLA